MRHDDDELRPPPEEGAEGSEEQATPDPEAPSPATWAGRERAGANPPEDGEVDEAAEVDAAAADVDADAPAPEFTEEFDEVGRDLDGEFDQLDEEEPPEPEQAAPEPAEEDEGVLDLDEPGTELDEQPQQAEAEAEVPESAEPEAEVPEQTESEEAVEADDEPASPGETVEAETVGLADRAEAEEAAMAGLRKRAAAAPQPPAAPAAEEQAPEEPAPPEPATAAEDGDGQPPRAKPIWARFLAASLLIVISMATATSVSLLVYLTDIAAGLGDNDALAPLRDQLEEVDGGAPQTILIIGSDKRLSEPGVPGRSDTTILLRVDPEKDAIALLSIPRDLKVNIPKVGIGKFNLAYTTGGPGRTLDVVKQLTGLDINHVVNINFTGFADAVNAIDCVYIDVDRRYFIPEESNYSAIDIEAGYQRLCGFKALQYVRYRFDDNDLVRSARQQDFLREARQKLPAGTLIRDRNELLDIFTEYTTSDIGEAVPLLELLKTFIGVQDAPVSEVHFPAQLGDATSEYVTHDDEALQKAVDQFLGVEGTPGARPAGKPDRPPEDEGEKRPKEKKPAGEPEGPPMIDATAAGQQYAQAIENAETKGGDPMVRFPVFFPTRLTPESAISDASRAFPIDGPDKEKYYGYKMVVSVPGPSGFSEYYGVSGTNWEDVPILENPSETREIDGRDYRLFYDGDRLRLIGWKTGKASYWVSNSLLQSVEDGEMVSIATSMRELGG
ncbi:MAG: LCP family protein [Solirubrobacterales bacterium]